MTTASTCCDALPERFPATAMTDLPELSSRVEELRIDAKKWITTYRCRVCGAIWDERYESAGHANIPTLFRTPRNESGAVVEK